jgi:Na+-driven multidrug efflux pump
VLIRPFSQDPAVIAVGAPYLHIISWNFVAIALAFTCSSLFQALGNTWPSLLSSSSRLITYVVPLIYLGVQGNFQLEHVWYLSVASTTLQAILSLLLLQRQFRQSGVSWSGANSGSVLSPSDH